MIQNLVQHRQEKILWNIFFLKTGRASVSILHQQETLLFRLAGKEARYAEGYAVPASAFEEQEDGTYQAQISGAMGRAWCQVWCLDDGYWENVEVTPPAGIEQIQKSVEEMKLPKGRLGKNFIPECRLAETGWGNTGRRTDACSFLFAGEKEMSCTEKWENECRELYGCVLRVAKIKGIKMAEPTGQEYFRDSERKVSGDYRRTMGKVVRAGVAGTFWKKRKAKSGAGEKNNRSGRENFTAGFLKLRSGI